MPGSGQTTTYTTLFEAFGTESAIMNNGALTEKIQQKQIAHTPPWVKYMPTEINYNPPPDKTSRK